MSGASCVMSAWAAQAPKATDRKAANAPPIYRRRSKRSERLAVHVLHGQRFEFEVFEAAHVDGRHLVAARVGAPGKGLDAAMPAEAVLDGVLVECVGS